VGSLIDTSVLVASPGAGKPRDAGKLTDSWAVSVVTVGELEAGVLIARDETIRARRLALLAAVLAEAPALPVDRHVAARFGELRASSARQASNDLWIAATALAHDFTLVTADERQASLPLVRATLVEV
jgi:predicted nucleic acid-binding protein